MTNDQIREVFLANGFTIKPGETDLKPYVYAAAKELLEAALKPGEVVAMRGTFDGYGYDYIDSGAGSDWLTRHPDWEPVYDGPPAQTPVALKPVAPVYRTDQQIVDQTEELAKFLLSWGFNHEPTTDVPMRDSAHPFAERCWDAACHIQEMLTATDVKNAVDEIECEQEAAPPAQTPAALKPRVPVTWAEAEAIAIRPSVEDAIEVLLADQTLDNATGVVMAVLNAAPPAQTLCHCKDRPASECPGEWEPGCDLGNNEDHAVAAQTPPPRLTEQEIAYIFGGYAPSPSLIEMRILETAVRRQWAKQFGVNDE